MNSRPSPKGLGRFFLLPFHPRRRLQQAPLRTPAADSRSVHEINRPRVLSVRDRGAGLCADRSRQRVQRPASKPTARAVHRRSAAADASSCSRPPPPTSSPAIRTHVSTSSCATGTPTPTASSTSQAPSPRPASASARARRRPTRPAALPVISADGRYVAFVSTATNLVAGAERSAAGLPRRSHDRRRRPGQRERLGRCRRCRSGGARHQRRRRRRRVPVDGATNLVTDAGSALPACLRPGDHGRSDHAHFARSPRSLVPSRRPSYVSADDLRRSASASAYHGPHGAPVDGRRPTCSTGDRRRRSRRRRLAASALTHLGVRAGGRLAYVDAGARVASSILVRTTPALAAPLGTPEFALPCRRAARYVLTAGARLHDFDFGTSTSLGFVAGRRRFQRRRSLAGRRVGHRQRWSRATRTASTTCSSSTCPTSSTPTTTRWTIAGRRCSA